MSVLDFVPTTLEAKYNGKIYVTGCYKGQWTITRFNEDGTKIPPCMESLDVNGNWVPTLKIGVGNSMKVDDPHKFEEFLE